MKVLEAGKYTNEWKIQHRCTGAGNGGNGCEALLEVEKSDLRHRSARHTEGVWGDWADCEEAILFKCPICDTLTDLAHKDWPKNITKLLEFTNMWRYYGDNDVGD